MDGVTFFAKFLAEREKEMDRHRKTEMQKDRKT